MKFFKVRLIVAVYKDIEALELILDTCAYQTYDNFEVVVAEDGNSLEMKEFMQKNKNRYDFDIIHATQEDIGVRKSKSQNNGILSSSGEYLIFIDGDCLLYSDFIKNHVALSATNHIVTGRRVNLGPKYSDLLRKKKMSALELEKTFLLKYLDIKKDAKLERHSEEGFIIKPNGFIDKLIKKIRKKNFPLLGCNMSFYKKSIYEINGFDEGLGNSAMAGDTDLEWRFKSAGYNIISARYSANLFHLFHKRSPNDYNRALDEKMLQNQKSNTYVCKDGLK
jgi:cellulose synthase/poly-beta-1,6-N-acetylglucosamine synthase-like glycosyltransferase